MDEKVYNECVTTVPLEISQHTKIAAPHRGNCCKTLHFHAVEHKVYILQHVLADAIRRGFDAWGYAVATRPCLFALISVFAAIIFSSLGALRFRMSQDVHTGYLAKEAEAMQELQIYKAFYGSAGRPYYFGLMVQPKDGHCNGSILEEECFEQTHLLHQFVFSNMSVQHQGSPLTFDRMCGSLCMTNEPLWVFKRPWDIRQTESFNQDAVQFRHPISSIYGFDVNLASYLYDVHENADGEIESAGLACLWYASDSKDNTSTEENLRDWELSAFRTTVQEEKEHGQEKWPSLHIVPYGNYVVNEEVMRAGSGVTPHYSVGLACMLAFMAISSALSTLYYAGMFRWSALGLSLAAVAGPVLATAQTFGIISLMDYSVNVMMMIAPFLILAVGVDDAFLLVHSWQRHAHHPATGGKSSRHRLRLVLAEIGPSMLITSLTNSVAFSIGAFASPPEISKFCAAVALGMVAIFANQLCFFSPLMVLALNTATQPAPPLTGQAHSCAQWRAQTTSRMVSLWRSAVHTADVGVGYLSEFMCCTVGRIVAALSFVVYLYIAVQGVLLMKAEMSPEVLIPEDSILQETFHLRHEFVWKEYQPIWVIVNKVVDFESPKQYGQVMDLVNDLEAMPHSAGKDLTMFWLRDYRAWRNRQNSQDSWLAFEEYNYDLNPENALNNSVRMDALGAFLNMEQHAHWRTDVRYHMANETEGRKFIIDKFLFQVAYRNICSLGERARAVQQWRKVIHGHQTTLNSSLWDPDAPHADIMLNVRNITMKTLLLTLCSMALACFLFIPNTAGLLCAVAAIASTSTGVTGLLHWWHADLDPVLMADLIMAIGFSVDYTAHASFHFYRIGAQRHYSVPADGKSTSSARLHQTYRSVLWPTLQAGVSTIMCMAPQSLSPMRAHIIFVKTVVLVVCLGILHGMFWIPAFLCSLPASWTGEQPSDKTETETAAAPNGNNENGALTVSDPVHCNGNMGPSDAQCSAPRGECGTVGHSDQMHCDEGEGPLLEERGGKGGNV